MVVSFDSLNRYEIPQIWLCNPSSKIVNNIPTSVVGILSDDADQEIVFQFNALSQLNFRIYKIDREDVTSAEAEQTRRVYFGIRNRRMLYVEGIGYFVITSVTETVTDTGQYKDVSASSCEVELENKNIPYIEDGTYLFGTLLNTVVAVLPKWTIGNVSSATSQKYRTFEDVSDDENVYSFLMDEMQNAYECIFQFDIKNRIIDVYDQSNFAEMTNVHISKDDFMKSLVLKESSDELYTALSVYGVDDLGINAVNPLGTSVIYNFGPYMSWMEPELAQKVSAWQTAVANAASAYYQKNQEYYGKLTDKSEASAELEKLNTTMTMYKRARDNIIAEASTYQIEGYNDVIEANGGEPIITSSDVAATAADIDALITETAIDIADVNGTIYSIDAQLEVLRGEIGTIQQSVAMASYFTQAEFEALSDYIYEGTYEDEYIAVYDSMTYSQQLAQMKTLYDRAVVQFEIICKPRQEFSVDVDNFIFHKDFAPWTAQMKTGCLINVETGSEVDTLWQDDNAGDGVAQLFLSQMTINYSDQSLALTFSNRYDKTDPETMFKDALGDVKKTSNTVNFIKTAVSPIRSGVLNYMQEEIDASRTLTKNDILSSTSESVIIDDTGYTGRRSDGNGGYEPEQIKITCRNIAFTDDAWETAKTALGSITLPGGTSTYGINAETVVGDLVVGQELRIVNSSGQVPYATTDEAISTVTVQYALGTSAVTAPQTGWSAVAPAWEDGKFMWQRTVTAYVNGTTNTSSPTCLSGATGQSGADGSDGVSVLSVVAEYYLSTSSSTQTGSFWTTIPPAWSSGEYIWVRTVVTRTDGSQTYTDPQLDNSLNSFGNAIIQQNSLIEANADGIEMNFQRYQQLNSQVQEINDYITVGVIGSDGQGNNILGVKIGKSGEGRANLESRFTSDELGFYDSNEKVAFFSNKKLNVNTGRFGSIELTDSVGSTSSNNWVIDCTNGFSIRWIGS